MAGKITCRSVAAINWIIPPEPLDLQQNDVHVWRISNAADDNNFIGKYESLLNTVEFEKANRFFKTEDRCRYVVTRAALRIILSQYLKISAKSIVFKVGENKKPQLAGISKQLRFNVSHSGSYSLVGISKFDLGIDIEFINNQFVYSDIVNNYFNNEEADLIISSTRPTQTFFTCWTRKEALLKAISTGLNTSLLHIPCLDGEHLVDPSITDRNWEIKTFNIDQSYLGSVAVNAGLEKIACFNFEHSILEQQ